MVDDIDDNERDVELGRLDRDASTERRSSLIFGLVAVDLVILVLNWGTSAMLPALGAVVGMLVGAFVLKPVLSGGVSAVNPTSGSAPKDACMGVVTEGVAFLMLAYPYFAWAEATQRSLDASIVLPTVGVFWTSFEIWKISRYLTRPTWRVYGFSWPAARVFLLTMLASSLVCQIRVWALADLPFAFLVVAVGGPFGLALWLLRGPTRGRRSDEGPRPPPPGDHLAGLLFVALVDVSVILAAATALIG